MFVGKGKGKSPFQSGATERYFTRVGSGLLANNRLG
jgi:hypothetical protein